MSTVSQTAPTIQWKRSDNGTLVLRLTGTWKLSANLPAARDALETIRQESPTVKTIGLDVSEVESWDSGLLAYLVKIVQFCRAEGITVENSSIPARMRRLLDLALASHDTEKEKRSVSELSFLERTGEAALGAKREGSEFLEFVGALTLAFGNLLRGRARFRGTDLATVLQETGANALPIVTLINMIVGAILAYVGSIQLKQFGAQIFVANLVAIAVIREMASVMTGIVLAGRTGSSFAATLGTMTVNEEIDALETMGFRPVEFLVLPRALALALMTPLLCIYANLMGVIGGMLVGVFVLDLSAAQYYEQTRSAFAFDDFFVGLIKGSVYGVLVAVAGCLRGLQSGRSAAAVGEAATSAAVTGIVMIVIADLILTIIFDFLGI